MPWSDTAEWRDDPREASVSYVVSTETQPAMLELKARGVALSVFSTTLSSIH